MKRAAAVLLPALLLLVPAPASAQEPVPFEGWSKKLDDLIEEVRSTRRLRDRIAFLREAGKVVRTPATPRAEVLKKLDELLKFAPEGDLQDGILDALVADGSLDAVKILLGTFDRDDYENLKERRLGDEQIATRRRIVEFRLLEAADQAYLEVLEGHPPAVEEPVQAFLIEQLKSENLQRVRGAALLLGGWSVEAGGEHLLAALSRKDLREESWTRAVLLEALGRTNPSLATEQILDSAGSHDVNERLAALPLLGYVETDASNKLIKKALKNKRWYVRRAAIEACDIRRDPACIDMLISDLFEETPRLQKDIYEILDHATANQLPHTPQDIKDWWKVVKDGFKAVPRGRKNKVEGAVATRVRHPKRYFTMTVGTNQVAIVFDTSGSMQEGRIRLEKDEDGKGGGVGTPFDVTKQQIIGLLKSFRGKALFNLISYADEVKPFKRKLTRNSRGNLKAAAKYLDGLKAKGETNLYDALMLTLSDSEVDTIFLLSDGAPNRGARIEARDILEGIQLANRFRKVRINTIQIGDPSPLMEAIAKSNGGQYKLVEHLGASK
jgi:hypothetical protein